MQSANAWHYSITPALHHSISAHDHRPPKICCERATALGRTGIVSGQAGERSGLPARPRTVEALSLSLRADFGRSGEDHDLRFRTGDTPLPGIARGAGLRRDS